MTDAFVLINVAMGHEADVLAALRDIEGISMVHGTFGAYDVIVKVESDDTTDMRSTITEKIRNGSNRHATLALLNISVARLPC